MKKIYGDDAIDIMPAKNGFLIASKQNTFDNKIVVAYKFVSFEKATINPVTKNVYLLAKFGNNFNSFEMQIKNHVFCKTIAIDSQRLFAVTPDGEAKIFDREAHTEWQGTMKYKGNGPNDIALYGHTLWASFPENNALIRFNLRTMREELRIGGSNDAAVNHPEGLWIGPNSDTMLVCNSGAKNILEINLKSYTVYIHATFDEPVRNYIKIGSNEIVHLDTGIFKL